MRPIFASVAKAFLASTAKLDVLTARPARPRYLSQSEPYEENLLLPYWVPDWTQDTASFLFTSISATQFSTYNALQKFVSDQQSISPSQNDTGDTRYTGFNANLGGDCQSCFKFTDNDEILHVRGAMADKIVSIGDPLDLALASLAHYSPGDHSHEHYRKVHSPYLAIIKGWERLCLELSASAYRPTGGPIVDAF
ncbi:hypothetical protein MAJ_11363, partial [Metarhizium majus ARSEF 297]